MATVLVNRTQHNERKSCFFVFFVNLCICFLMNRISGSKLVMNFISTILKLREHKNVIVRHVSTLLKQKWLQKFENKQIDNPKLCIHELDKFTKSFVPDVQLHTFEQFCKRRVAGEPLQYIIEEWDFRELTLKMRKPVFIPRPETELLIDLVKDDIENTRDPVRLLEIGCGSGAISLSLLNECQNISCSAIEISEEAVKLTLENAEKHSLQKRLQIIQKDIANITEPDLHHEKYDILVSNPPYIPSRDIEDLQVEVKSFEDHVALDGGNDGMDVIKIILSKANSFLKPNSSIWLEVDETHPPKIKKLTESLVNISYVATHDDYYGNHYISSRNHAGYYYTLILDKIPSANFLKDNMTIARKKSSFK